MQLNNFKDVIVLDEVDSTNDYIKNLPTMFNYVVIAKSQTKGKGTQGKTFFSPKNKGLYMSFTDDFEEFNSNYLVALVALSFKKTIFELYNKNLTIKWINDLYYNNRKLGGILVETIFNGSHYQKTVFGIGINIFKSEVPVDLKNKIISLDEFVPNIDLDIIIKQFFQNYIYYKSLEIDFVNSLYLKSVRYYTNH